MKALSALFLLSACVALAEEPVALPPPSEPVAVDPATPAATAPVTTAVPGAEAPAPNAFFPGIKIVMTPEEFASAGLDALSPEQLAVINTAIIRHYQRTVAKEATQQATEMTQQALAEDHQKTWLARVGLPDISLSQDWKTLPGIKGKCTGWVTGNSFRLDNDQVWEGVEPIRMELAGRDIEIQPRPNGAFALIVDGKNTTLRVMRVK